MHLPLLLLFFFAQLHPASSGTIADIKITEMKPEHVEPAKEILYHAIHELQFMPFESVDAAKALCTQMNVCKDYNNANEHYFDNRGTFLVILLDNKVVGTGAIKKVDDTACELKRFYFAPEIRGKGLSKILCEQLFATARRLGYTTIYLEMYKPETQQVAKHLFEKLGFKERAEPYYEGSICRLFMEREL